MISTDYSHVLYACAQLFSKEIVCDIAREVATGMERCLLYIELCINLDQ